MSNEARDDCTTEAQSDAAENTGADTLRDEHREEDEAEQKRWRDELDRQRSAMGNAEETCVFLIDDLLAAIFEEMQVRSENTSLFATSARQACLQVFEGVDVSAFQASDSLDRIRGLTQYEPSSRQQILKAQSTWTQSPQSRISTCGAPASSSVLAQPTQPLLFLRRLLNFLEKRVDRADLELMRFSMSEAISSLSGKRRLLRMGNTSGSGADHHNEWCIPVEQIPVFLQELLSRGLVSAMPSTIAFVVESVNREPLDKMMHSHTHVALPHLQRFVQNALLTAEETEENNGGQTSILPESSEAETKSGTASESTPRPRVFQTEVPPSKVTFGNLLKAAMKGPQAELLSSYLEEIAPRASEMDRRAPGQIGKKSTLGAANPSQRAIRRKILLLLAPSPRVGSRWKTVRHKLVVPSADEASSNGVESITAVADMEFNLAGAPAVPGQKAAGLPVETSGAGSIAENEEMQDAASLSNIFSLGTPRQLSAQELARRNDLLAQLGREADRAKRRATTTAMASMSLDDSTARHESDGSGCPAQTDHQQFQAYVAANSTLTLGVESDGHTKALSPTRPQQIGQAAAPRNRGRGNVQRSKFELERDTLPCTISDGNAHVREEQEHLLAAMCSPIKRPKASIAPSPPLETPERSIQTASALGHLPQLDSSRLAVGVSAVVRGVEKRGPRRNPSRKTRLQLHNYSAAYEDVDDPETGVSEGGQMPFSPVRTTGQPSSAASAPRGSPEAVGKVDACRLPLIPVVSPIKASPHRKHVAFKFQNDVPVTISPKAHVRHHRSSTKAKQPVWEVNTSSPPRARNQHFASGKHFRKFQHYEDEDEETTSARRRKQEEQDSSIFCHPMAPRRNVLPTSSEE